MNNSKLRSRWLALMRASTHRALGRECDYARAEGDVDTFDPIGLLALAAGYECEGHGSLWRCILAQTEPTSAATEPPSSPGKSGWTRNCCSTCA